jgi:hypothetical protein
MDTVLAHLATLHRDVRFVRARTLFSPLLRPLSSAATQVEAEEVEAVTERFAIPTVPFFLFLKASQRSVSAYIASASPVRRRLAPSQTD